MRPERAKEVLVVYRERCQRALAALRANDFEAFEPLERQCRAAFHNFKAILSLTQQNFDTTPKLNDLYQEISVLIAELAVAVQESQRDLKEKYIKIKQEKSRIAHFRSQQSKDAGFERTV